MVKLYHQVALRFEKISWLIWISFLATLTASGYVIFSGQQFFDPESELLFIVLTMWFASILALKSYFKEIPSSIEGGKGIIRRVIAVTKRIFSWLMALLFTLLTISMFFLSVRSVSLVL